MKIFLYDTSFPLGSTSFGMGVGWLRWKIARTAHTLTPSLPDADIVFVSCSDPRDSSKIKRIRKKTSAPIIAGGFAGYSPYSLGQVADLVCVGNGDEFVDTVLKTGVEAARKLPNCWVNGEDRPVDIAHGHPWDMPLFRGAGGMYRVLCGFGCKKQCNFCQVGWGLEYSEHPDPGKIVKMAKAVSGELAYISNDLMQHSFYHRLPQTSNGSFSLPYLKKHGLPAQRQVRLGIEGVSERMRSLVGKRLSHRDLVDSAVWLSQNKKSVRWFLIAGLPGETDADWDELRRAVQEWKERTDKNVLALSFTAWQPEPATPLGIFPVVDDYHERFTDFSEWFFAGQGWSNRIQLYKPAGPVGRMKSAVARMGLSEDELRTGGKWGPNDRVIYPKKDLRNRIALKISQKTGILCHGGS